jgi:hypothetical protein
MHNDIDALHGPAQAIHIADVSQKEAQAGMIQPVHAHLMLFQLVPAEDDQFLGMIVTEHHPSELLPERAGSAGHQNCSLRPVI